MARPGTRGPATAIRALSIALVLATSAGAAPAATPVRQVQAELVSELSTIEPGATFWVALRQIIAPGWHTYWENPGDSGEPATIAWNLPDGFTAGGITWPPPRRIPIGPFVSYGYEGEVLLPIRVTAPAGLPVGAPVILRARAAWLVCKRECVPEEASVDVALQVGAKSVRDARWGGPVARAVRAVPVPSPWPAGFHVAAADHVRRVAGAGRGRHR